MPTAPEKDIGILRAARYLNRYLKDFRSDGSETHSEIEDQIRKLKTMISQEAEDDNESEPGKLLGTWGPKVMTLIEHITRKSSCCSQRKSLPKKECVDRCGGASGCD